MLTFFLVFAVLAATDRLSNSGMAGVAIGTCLTVVHPVGIPVTGTSVNPARSIGPALFVHGAALTQLWLFVVAPVIGGVIGGVTYHFVWGAEQRVEEQDINADGR